MKIDRSLVEHLGRSARDRQIVAAVIAMAHTLGMSAVPEGTETNEQLDELASLGCDVSQGFLFAHPLPAKTVAELRRGRSVQRARLSRPRKVAVA